MMLLRLTAAYAVLLTSGKRLVTNAFTLPSRTSESVFRLNAANDEMVAAINKVMKSAPPPHIPDESVVQHTSLLVSLWDKIAFPNEDDEDTDFKLSDYGLGRKDVGGFITHFQTCKDCAADHAFLMATQDDDGNDVLRLSNVYFSILSEVDDDSEWGRFNPEMLGDEINTRTIFPEEPDDQIVLDDTKEWVQKVIADFGVCPFTIDKNRAGIPMGGVRYAVSRAVQPELAFLRYWEEVEGLLKVTEKEMSTVLLVFPELSLFGNYELFEAYCESLSDALCGSTMGMESEIQLVFFHPKYHFRDGQARTGNEMGAANFARRSPWPMINILRTPQVKAAQKGVPTGQVYKQNEERLAAVGTTTLETMLYDRDWAALPAHAQHSKSVRAQELKAGKELSISTDEVITGRIKESPVEEVQVPAGVCPFPHGMTAAVQVAVQDPVQDPVELFVDEESVGAMEDIEVDTHYAAVIATPLTDLMDSLDDSSSTVDYAALADEVERWLAQEELERNQ